MMFRDQVGIVAGWFRGWSECEQTVALLALLKRVTRTQARFLQLCLEHSLQDCPDIHRREAEANSAALPCQLHPSPLKRSLSLVPGSPQPGQGGEWAGGGGPEDPPAAPRAPPPFGEHAPLSPQSSVASSGSEHTEEPGGRNSFQEDGSGMKDVPSWLKSLRLHKYAALFAQMSYEEMMTLTEHHLESQNVTKGARHKIALSIQKLRERQSVLRALEKG
ncbi:PREDICTED: protein Smaug homolog 2 [Lepidothrix coronata]|uniref:Protein Smaug homolog 2 n=1 Tax=Lepidothrix coronata TaxID=321398 RepID=A0A6J0J7Z3_9PASS|nr:PREDICTED: protein Smaug homolog 2 [Lepidothrix coronata]